MDRSSTKTTRITLVFFCTLIVWILKLIEYFKLPVDLRSDSFSGVHAVVTTFSSSESGDLHIMIGVFIVLLLTHLRIFFGIEFSSNDSSFNKALAQLDDHEQEQSVLLIGIILAVLSGITILLSYLVSLDSIWWMPTFVFVESIIIIIFDIKLSKALLSIDQEKRANWIIVINDLIFLSIGCLFILSPVMSILNMQLPQWIFCVLVGSYAIILITELITGYSESLGKAWDDTCLVIKGSRNFLLRNTPKNE